VRMAYYEVSQHIPEILISFSPVVEPLSLDEAFMDMCDCEDLFAPRQGIAPPAPPTNQFVRQLGPAGGGCRSARRVFKHPHANRPHRLVQVRQRHWGATVTVTAATLT
jgi:nucleotidyltransferase/DNA polymerase involved in DNA repair